jgi:hypothetical protein
MRILCGGALSVRKRSKRISNMIGSREHLL